MIATWNTVEPQPLDLDAPLIEVDTARAVDGAALASRVATLLEMRADPTEPACHRAGS